MKRNVTKKMRQRIKTKVPVYINGKLTGDTRGESVDYRLRKIKRLLGPVEKRVWVTTLFGVERILSEKEVEECRKAGMIVWEKVVIG